MRKQPSSEIIVDTDDRSEKGLLCYMQTGINLVNSGYHIELWYASGMKNPHIHIKDIVNLDTLSKEEGKEYRILFLEKYTPREYWNDKIPDYSMANAYEDEYHPIAEENKPHHKYKTIKKLVSEFNADKINFVEIELYNEAVKRVAQKKEAKIQREGDTTGTKLYQKIGAKISIVGLADKFGLKPMGKRLRVCPFHADSSPSLSLNDELALFKCFGCEVSGNIIKFYAMLKKLNPEFRIK